MKRIFALALICIFVASCAQVTAYDCAVTVKTKSKEARYVRLEVVSPKIIRVSSGMKSDFNRDKSLMAVYKNTPGEWSIESDKEHLVVKTSELTAKVDLNSANVSFYDKNGDAILSENGCSITPISFGTDNGYTLYQNWSVSADEAFYGLGQHQGDEFNWAGRNEKLIQYNTKVTIPFLVSSNGYGILWDNYSMSRFGDPRDYAQIGEVFKLYRNDGSEGALTGTYNAPGHSVIRDEPILYLENEKALSQYLIKDFPLKGANVVYDGFIEPAESGLFRFMLYYSGYVKVFLDNTEVVAERWRTAWNPNTYKFDYELEAGKKLPIRIEWRPDGNVAYCSLRALTPDTTHPEPHIAFWSEMGDFIDYYFVKGDNLDEVVSGYRHITGKAPVMPKWSMGLWQCKERYTCSNDIYEVLDRFKKADMPIDMIIQDWFYWQEDQWGSHEFDRSRYPNPKAMVDSIHDAGVHYMISVWPKFYLGTEHFEEFDSKGWMYRRAIEDSIRDWVGQGYVGSMYDAYNADARELFWNQMEEHLLPYGIDAWWMDASEPNIRDCVDMDYWKALCNPTALGSSTKYLNAYGLMNADAIYTGQRSVKDDARVLLLTRSGFAGIQRFSTAIWSGDIASRWEDLKAQIPAGINFSMAGVPWWSMDIGGFCVEDRHSWGAPTEEETEEWRELQTRWHQFGAFVPFFRIHGQFPAREFYNVAPEGHPARRSMEYYTNLRYRLLPYVYSLAGDVWKNDYTIMRGLAMDFPKDNHGRNVGDEYMFGPSILVAPVYKYKARSREVYLPENQGGWYNFYSGAKISAAGGETIAADAPYDRMPLFVRAGSIIPTDESHLKHSLDQDASRLTLNVYAGADCNFTLYEDDGVTYGYEKGEYCTIPFEWDDAASTLRIGECTGTYSGMPQSRTITIHIVGQDVKKDKIFTYSNKSLEIKIR
ncbi:MAG: DUF5110 domain-containing protein [Bacteroidales bacterium]|nr:DUF5110 domain-containing protein [Bacteroidales bacterium]